MIGAMGNLSTTMTNLYTVAPNVFGAVFLLILAFASDFTQVRSIYVMISFGVSIIGFAAYAAVDIEGNRAVYGITFAMTACNSGSVILAAWYNNNTPG